VELPWSYHGATMELLWSYCGATVELPGATIHLLDIRAIVKTFIYYKPRLGLARENCL
jgi:hypothetical protein